MAGTLMKKLLFIIVTAVYVCQAQPSTSTVGEYTRTEAIPESFEITIGERISLRVPHVELTEESAASGQFKNDQIMTR